MPYGAQEVLMAASLVYADLWVRQRALLHVVSRKLDVPSESLEREVDAWVGSHSEELALEMRDRFRRLMQPIGLSDYIL